MATGAEEAGDGGSPLYLVRLRRVKGRPVLFFEEVGITVAAATLRWEHWLWLLEEWGFERKGRKLWATSSSRYFLSALAFYSVAQTMRRPDKLEELKYVVEELDIMELRFWGAVLRRGYEAAGRRGLYRPARSFKVLYGLSR